MAIELENFARDWRQAKRLIPELADVAAWHIALVCEIPAALIAWLLFPFVAGFTLAGWLVWLFFG